MSISLRILILTLFSVVAIDAQEHEEFIQRYRNTVCDLPLFSEKTDSILSISLRTLISTLFSVVGVGAQEHEEFIQRYRNTVCGQTNEAFITELGACILQVPQEALTIILECYDKFVPSANRSFLAIHEARCKDRSFPRKIDDCVMNESPAAIQKWDEEGEAEWQCTKSTFAKYGVEIVWPERHFTYGEP